MYQAYRILIIFILIMIPSWVNAAPGVFDGNIWVKWPVDGKLIYLVGYFDGSEQGILETTKTLAPELWSQWLEGKIDPRIATLDLKNITVEQIMAGVNQLFDDYRNRHIPLAEIVSIAIDEVSGRKAWMEEDIARLRRVYSK